MKKIQILKLIFCLVLSFIPGLLGLVFTVPSISTWYITLNKPIFSPPNWIFAPVWNILYLLMGVSLYLVWVSKKSSDRKTGLKYYSFQLVLNGLWSILFFGLRSPLIGFVNIILLWYFIYMTIKYFGKVNKLSAYLLYPYIVWVSFATILNLFIVLLNR